MISVPRPVTSLTARPGQIPRPVIRFRRMRFRSCVLQSKPQLAIGHIALPLIVLAESWKHYRPNRTPNMQSET